MRWQSLIVRCWNVSIGECTLQVGRHGPLVFGAQCEPGSSVHPVSLDDVTRSLADVHASTSYAVAYQPEHLSPFGRGTFTAAVELVKQRELVVSFLHHMAVQRRAYNPFEDEEVIRRKAQQTRKVATH